MPTIGFDGLVQPANEAMATGTPNFNPYQAPIAPSTGASLSSDTEFLFNDKVVAGAGAIVLPRVCVVTGSTDSLVARESRLWWCIPWITALRAMSVFAALFIGIPMLTNLPSAAPGLSGSPIALLLQLAFGAGVILGAAALVIVSSVLQVSIHVRWFISQRVVDRSFYFSMFSLVLSIAATVVVMQWVTNAGLGILVAPAIWGLASGIQVIRGKHVLFVANHKDGLFLIGGLSDQFLTETKRMADEYTARTGS